MITRLSIIFIFFPLYSFAQFESHFGTPVWGKGKITLNSGEELTGLVKYNAKSGGIAFDNGEVKKNLMARNVLGFDFVDPKTNVLRTFYSLEIPRDDGNSATIFEVIRLYETFAVLSCTESLQVLKSEYGVSPAPGISAVGHKEVTGLGQRETIWFLPADGEPTIYLEFIKREGSGTSENFPYPPPWKTLDFGGDKRKIEDKDIFKVCTGDFYSAIKAYAKENNLSFKNKDHLFKLLDFYEVQVAKQSN